MKKILAIFGTRPEAIKLAPVIAKLRSEAVVKVCVTGQHRRMLDQALQVFNIDPNYDLDIMTDNQGLCDLSAQVLTSMSKVLDSSEPDVVLVQGDTVTASMGALSAFYNRIPVAHVEAGLRTYDLRSPFPEELNRQIVARIASLHFAPTQNARSNLIQEGVSKARIFVTGNTVVDALQVMISKARGKKWEGVLRDIEEHLPSSQDRERKMILVTGHRRENFGEPFREICGALKLIARKNPDVKIVYPVHLNPNVEIMVRELLADQENILLFPPVDYLSFLKLMDSAYLILTDSGGIQEEAPTLAKPLLVMRTNTERPEGVDAGVARLVGTKCDDIVSGVMGLLKDEEAYSRMQSSENPYGDGQASQRIVDLLKMEFMV
jgi:UDP-N-acetylglucosamine 2-epimerase (non-hydrolysing)